MELVEGDLGAEEVLLDTVVPMRTVNTQHEISLTVPQRAKRRRIAQPKGGFESYTPLKHKIMLMALD